MRNRFASFFRSVLERFRRPRRVPAEPPLSREQFREMLIEALDDPATARLLARRVLGPVFPVEGGQSTSADDISHGDFGSNCGPDENDYTFSRSKVGIGTTTPSQQLDVVGNIVASGLRPVTLYGSSPYGASIKANPGGWAFGYRALGSGGTDVGGFGFYGSSDSLTRYFIGTYSTGERISILSSGNVGIGTTSPENKLHVMDGHIAIEAAAGEGKLKFRDSSTHTTRNEIYRDTADITILRNWNEDYTILKIWAPTGAVVNDREATLSLARGDNDDEMVDVFNNGYVTEGDPYGTQYGIRSMRRQGTGEFRDFVFDQWHKIPSNPTPVKLPAIMVLKPTRKVGIGIRESLTARLNIRGDFTAKGKVSVQAGFLNTVVGTDTLFTAEINVGDKVQIGSDTRTVAFITDDTHLTVDTDFSTPYSDVNMTVMNNLLRLDDSSGTAKVFVNEQGNVGIGTTSPAATLDVQGDALLAKTNGKVGFYGTTPITKPTVTGSRANNIALANLLTALSQLGLIVDNTTA